MDVIDVDKAVAEFREKIEALKSQSSSWETNRPYGAVIQPTLQLGEKALRLAIESYARAYVEIASTGQLGTSDATVPDEFEENYSEIVEAVRAAPNLESACAALRDQMYDVTHFGWYLKPTVSLSEVESNFHLDANQATLDAACESIWAIMGQAQRVASLGTILASRIVWDGLDGPAGADVQSLLFWSQDAGAPPYVRILLALKASVTTEKIASGVMQEWTRSWEEATDDVTLKQLREDIEAFVKAMGGLTNVVGGLAGLALVAVLAGLYFRARG